MGIFSALFSSKPKPSAPAGSVAASKTNAVRPTEPQRVVATSGIPTAKANGASTVPKPVASAAALQMPRPVVPRSITQRLIARPALPGPQSSEPARHGETNGLLGEVTLLLGDVLPQIPPSVLDQNAPVDPNRTLSFPVAQLSAEMARGRPAVPLVSVARQCPELFRQPESIDSTEMVRLPLQKLLEQIGKLKRIDFANPPRALPPAPAIETRPQPEAIEEPAVKPAKAESAPLPSWLDFKGHDEASGNEDAPIFQRRSIPLEKPAEKILPLFHRTTTDNAETIAAEIIEIVPAKQNLDEAAPIGGSGETEISEQIAGHRIEEYEVPVTGDAPVVEVAKSTEAVLDLVESWPIEELEKEVLSLPSKQIENPEAPQTKSEAPIASPPSLTAIPSAKSALTENVDLPPPVVRAKIQSAPFVVIGPFIPKGSTPSAGTFAFERVEMPEPPSEPVAAQPALEKREITALPLVVRVEDKTTVPSEPIVPKAPEAAAVAPLPAPVVEFRKAVETARVTEGPVATTPTPELKAALAAFAGLVKRAEPPVLPAVVKVEGKTNAVSEPVLHEVPESAAVQSPAPMVELSEAVEAAPVPEAYQVVPAAVPEVPAVVAAPVLPVVVEVGGRTNAPSEPVASEAPKAAVALSPIPVVELPRTIEATQVASGPQAAPPVPVVSVSGVAPAAPVLSVSAEAKLLVSPGPSSIPDFNSLRAASAPAVPKFPFRAPRSLTKSARAAEPVERKKPVPPRSPLLSFLPPEKHLPVQKPADSQTPRLFGANPLDRYFSTKASPPVNWCATGALLGLSGEVTPSRIADAIVKLPGVRGCMLAAPPNLTVSGEWPVSMGVDNSIAFGRRLALALKQRDRSIVAHRQIVTDAGMLLVFAIDDLVLCVAGEGGEITVAIRQRLLVIAKAMAHARQAVRKAAEAE